MGRSATYPICSGCEQPVDTTEGREVVRHNSAWYHKECVRVLRELGRVD